MDESDGQQAASQQAGSGAGDHMDTNTAATATQRLSDAARLKDEQAAAEIAKLKAQIEQMQAERKATGTLSFKVGEKGGMSCYGLGRFPVTLYKSQWIRLVEAVKAGMVEARIAEFGTALKERPDGK